jgi:hypothetical protein
MWVFPIPDPLEKSWTGSSNEYIGLSGRLGNRGGCKQEGGGKGLSLTAALTM